MCVKSVGSLRKKLITHLAQISKLIRYAKMLPDAPIKIVINELTNIPTSLQRQLLNSVCIYHSVTHSIIIAALIFKMNALGQINVTKMRKRCIDITKDLKDILLAREDRKKSQLVVEHLRSQTAGQGFTWHWHACIESQSNCIQIHICDTIIIVFEQHTLNLMFKMN